MTEYAICERRMTAVVGHYECVAWQSIPQSLVDALRGATPEQLQEAADVACLLRRCSQLRLQTRKWEDDEGETHTSWWGWVLGVTTDKYGTRREALRALVKAVKDKLEPWPAQTLPGQGQYPR